MGGKKRDEGLEVGGVKLSSVTIIISSQKDAVLALPC